MLVQEIQQFLDELKRRKVYRVAAAYAAFAFIVVQVADLVLPAFDAPDRAYRMTVIAALLGFPVAVILAWALELTPEGVRITRAREDGAATDRGARRRVLTLELLLAVTTIAAAIFLSWQLAGPVSDAGDRSIAVLPFEVLGDAERGHVIDGIHEDLLTRLSNVHGVSVIARRSVERYRGTDKTPAEIAAELNVHWILDGIVQRIGEQVRLSARLVDPGTGVQAWADSYEYDLSAANLFAVQSEITRQIADALQTRLTPAEKRTVAAMPTENLDAYRLFVEARTLLAQREEAQMRRALELFRRATGLDPGFTLAWVGIADSLYELVDYGFPMPAGTVDEAYAAAERALALEPDNPEAYVSLGIINHLRQNGPEALRYLERAIELRPGYAEAFSKVSWVAQILGRLPLATESAGKAMDLDPLAVEVRVNFALTRLIGGEPELALATLRPGKGLLQDWPTMRFYEGVVLYHMGNYREAVERLRGLSIPWTGHGPLATEALAYAGAGDTERAAAILGRLQAEAAHPFLVALVTASLGDTEAALGVLGSIEDWTTDADWPILAARYLYPRVLEPLRADARYDRMLRNLDRAWGLVM